MQLIGHCFYKIIIKSLLKTGVGPSFLALVTLKENVKIQHLLTQ